MSAKDINYLISFLSCNNDISKIRQIEEEKDLQFIALKNLYKNKNFSDENYLFLILANSLVCYQLSGKGEQYWQEFSEIALKYFVGDYSKEDILDFFIYFFRNGKYNRRFVNLKIKRLEKFLSFYEIFVKNSYNYYNDMKKLNIDLANIMNQKYNAKTIVFAVKMFGYGARLVYNKFVLYPFDIYLPIDSRLTRLYEIYGKGFDNINIFYDFIIKKTKIPPLHLDSILWVNFEYLI